MSEETKTMLAKGCSKCQDLNGGTQHTPQSRDLQIKQSGQQMWLCNITIVVKKSKDYTRGKCLSKRTERVIDSGEPLNLT